MILFVKIRKMNASCRNVGRRICHKTSAFMGPILLTTIENDVICMGNESTEVAQTTHLVE